MEVQRGREEWPDKFIGMSWLNDVLVSIDLRLSPFPATHNETTQ